MKKRLLSFVLMLSLLLSMFTAFATTASAADDGSGAATSASSTTSYLDLYVKDGLVALFDGYSVVASETDPAEWAPVDLYGEEGYEDYLDPSTYTYAFGFAGDTAKMTQVDGGYQMAIKGASLEWSHGAFLNLDSLGELLGTSGTITVQEVTSHAVSAPTVENNVVTNYSSLNKGLANYRGGMGRFGAYVFGGSQLTGANLDGYSKIVGCVSEQLSFGSAYIGHLTYSTAAYGCVAYPTLKGNDGTDLNGYTVGGPVTVERTITRLPYTEAVKTDDSGSYTEYTSKYVFKYLAAPSARARYAVTADGFTYSSQNQADHASTALRVAADGVLTRAVRIYNRELSASEISINHFADLVAFYGLDSADIAKVLSFDKFQAKALYGVTDAITIVATGKDTTAGSAYMLAKEAFVDAISYAEDATPAAPEAYVEYYVKDGLVALFDAYSAIASDDMVTLWEPENLEGVEGYDDYIDITTYNYALNGSWHWISGGLRPENTGAPNLNLNSLGELLGTVYTVQEILSYPLMTPEIENGVLLNNDEYETFGTYNAAAIGSFLYGPLNTPNIPTNLTGFSTPLHNVLFEQFCFGTEASYKYLTHAYYATAAYGGTVYNSLTDSSGRDYSGYTIAGGNTIIERSIARLGVTPEMVEGVTNYTSTFKVHYQFAPSIRNVGVTTDCVYSNANTTSTNESIHYSTTLRLAASDATYHSIRIYNRELSVAEYNNNHIVDLAAYCGADLSEYGALNAEKKVLVGNMMANVPMSKDVDAFEDAFEDAIAFANSNVDASSSLYVTDGLTVLLAAYEGFSTPYTNSGESSVFWSNGVDGGTYGVLKGTGWKKNATGGFTIVKTIDDYFGTRPEALKAGEYAFYTPKEQYGLEFDGALLPEASYTVELIANPVGITKEDGTRWIDTYSRYGTYIENGMAIGPLRAMQFSCYRASGNDGQMHRRWNYGVGNSPFADNGGKGLFVDTYWQGLELNEIVNFTVMMEVTTTQNIYKIDGGDLVTNYTREKSAVISNEDAGYMFRLMNGVAGTIFSVRVYDRVLSDAERAQNYMADLVYYYGIDAGLVIGVIQAAGGAIDSLADAFADLDFTMDRSEAQDIFNQRLTAIWLSENGYAIRGDKKDGIRYYFDINEVALNAVAKSGISVEIGTVVNIGKDAAPVVDNHGYDFKVVAYDSEMGKEASLFIDDDTYAVTVRYGNVGRESLIAAVKAIGYVKLTDSDGNATVYYTSPLEETPQSLFESYYLIDKAENSAVLDDSELSAFVANRIAQSYSDSYIYLDIAAADGGNGTEEAPYNDFASAFAASKEFLRGITSPTNLYLTAKDGRYSITETQEMLAADKPYDYSSFTVTSESGNAVLTTTVDIDAGKFVLEGDNIYSYQFEADENGEYPAFRSLYVNDGLAEIATSGSSRAAIRENLYVTAFDRTFNGIAYMAKLLRDEDGYGFDYMPENYKGREDLEEEFAYYRDKYIAYNDVYAQAKTDSTKLTYGMTPIQSTSSTAYNEAFNQFVLQFMAARDVRKIVHNEGLSTLQTNYFKTLAPRKKVADFGNNKTDYDVYVAAFNAARDAMYKANDLTLFYSDFEVALKDDVRHIGKLYMPEGMVGDLNDLIATGKVYMAGYADLLIEKATALIAQKEAEYAKQQIVFEAVTDAIAALDALKDEDTEDFAATLNEAIAATESALANATEDAVKVPLAKLLDAYKALKENLGADVLKSIEHEMATLTLAQDAERKLLVKAEEELSAAKTDLKSAQTVKSNVTDENLWVRHALTPYKIELHHTCQWNYNIVHLSGVDYSDYVEVETDTGVEKHIAIYMEMSEYSSFQINTGYSTADRYVHMKNAYGYLDENNEYFYDATVGKLYYYSDADIADYDFEYATLDNMFIFKDVEKIVFENVQLTGTDDYLLSTSGYTGGLSGMSSRYTNIWGVRNSFQDRAALYFQNCAGVTVKNCRLYDLSCEGINVTGWSEDYVIDGNSFENIGSAALRMGLHQTGYSDGNGSSWYEGLAGNRNVTVTNNYFGNIATEYYVPALMITKLEKGTIRNNTLIDCSYTAISVGWDWGINYSSSFQHDIKVNARDVDISYNYITNFMTEMGDGGAIYMPVWNGAVDNTDFYMNTVHHNTIIFSKTTGDGMGKMVVGIYFDASTSNWYCYENVVVEQSYGAHRSETDYEAYGMTEEEATLKRLRRQGSDYIYLQHIDDQECHNIFVQNNYILNVRAEESDDQFREIYQNFFSVKNAVEGRNLQESGTVYVVGLRNVPYEALDIVTSCGSTGHEGDPNLIYTNAY